ncbi:MAG: hypothetical protein WCG00_00985 [Hyphomicrobiales bacterium]
MRCSLPGALGAIVALVAALVGTLPAEAGDRTLPMRFDLRRQGPAESCGVTCKTYIAASGAITADSARDFIRAMQGRDLTGAVLVLDSDGGSVLGAIALGREVRRLRLAATVGRVVDLKGDVVGKAGAKDNAKDNVERNADISAVVSPRADCESMCAFVLLGGVQRTVPIEARVMVHQIWLGDRREDPTAATYSAEDLVLVQRDIGRLAQFTAEMGASIDLLDLALRIPPWEPLHTMTRDELRRTRLATDDAAAPAVAAFAVTPPVQASPPAPMTSGLRATPINEQRWAMVDRGGIASLARRHPFTVEGEPIGSFDLAVACGADADSFELSYIERRMMSDDTRLSAKPDSVSLRTGGVRARLAVTASQRHDGPGELVSTATGAVPAALIREFAGPGSHSMVIETNRKGLVTTIRIGNTGAQQSLPRLIASCAKPIGARADLAVRKIGGLASAQ